MQAQDPHLSPCLTPVCTSTLVIMQGMHELCQPERVFQDPRNEEGLMQAQFIWGEEKEVEEEDEEEQNVEKEEQDQQQQQVEGATFSFSWSGVPWRKWLLLQHPVSPRALWVSGPLPMPWLLVRGANMKSMASAGKMKC